MLREEKESHIPLPNVKCLPPIEKHRKLEMQKRK
jgi:hypothetical protein